jgi:two-component system LytT family response regulator
VLEFLGERSAGTAHLSRLAVKTPGKVIFVNVNDIDTIEAAGKYAVVHVGKETHILRETLTHFESKLPAERFLRISRSVILNIDRVQQLQSLFKGENVIVLKNGKRYSTSRPLREIQQKLEFR